MIGIDNRSAQLSQIPLVEQWALKRQEFLNIVSINSAKGRNLASSFLGVPSMLRLGLAWIAWTRELVADTCPDGLEPWRTWRTWTDGETAPNAPVRNWTWPNTSTDGYMHFNWGIALRTTLAEARDKHYSEAAPWRTWKILWVVARRITTEGVEAGEAVSFWLGEVLQLDTIIQQRHLGAGSIELK